MKRWWHTPVFYVTAFFANALFLVAAVWLYLRLTQEPSEPGDSYYAIVELAPALLTIVPATLSVWLLRRLARCYAWTRWWQWALAGAVVGSGVLWGLGRLGLLVERAHFSMEWQPAKNTLMLLFFDGPLALSFLRWWVALPALVATASVLFLVQRTLGWQSASKE